MRPNASSAAENSRNAVTSKLQWGEPMLAEEGKLSQVAGLYCRTVTQTQGRTLLDSHHRCCSEGAFLRTRTAICLGKYQHAKKHVGGSAWRDAHLGSVRGRKESLQTMAT